MKKERTIPKADRLKLYYARLNSDMNSIAELEKKYPVLVETGKEIRAIYDEFPKRMWDVGIDLPIRKNYFNRIVKDHAGLISYLKNTEKWTYIQREIAKRNAQRGPGNKTAKAVGSGCLQRRGERGRKRCGQNQSLY